MTTYTVTPSDLQGVAPNGQAFAIKRVVANPLLGNQLAVLFKQPDGTWTVKNLPAFIDMNQLQTLGAAALIVTVIPAVNLVLKQLFPAVPIPADPALADFDNALVSGFQVTLVDGVPQISAKQ